MTLRVSISSLNYTSSVLVGSDLLMTERVFGSAHEAPIVVYLM